MNNIQPEIHPIIKTVEYVTDEIKDVHTLALDPGNTTGYAFFHDELGLKELGTVQTPDAVSMHSLYAFIKEYSPAQIVIEEFRLYPGRMKSFIYSDMFVPQLIGSVKLIAQLLDIHLFSYKTPAVKSFTKLAVVAHKLNLPKTTTYTMHSLDAARHGLYHIHKQKRGAHA